ncbi:unnamed protein product [Allacma fusca]|uniref:Ubiquitin-like protease family profile domain-containing protein n=1 Tax=Allacma fusca TaxID=39272 RepID=A0A8J2NTK8_9HEXA|nr:unnamed protein product [Allacma fusca]
MTLLPSLITTYFIQECLTKSDLSISKNVKGLDTVEDLEFQESTSEVSLHKVKEHLFSNYAVNVEDDLTERRYVKHGLQLAIDNEKLERVSGSGLSGSVKFRRVKRKKNTKESTSEVKIVDEDIISSEPEISIGYYNSTRKRIVLPRYTTENAFKCVLRIRDHMLTLHDLKTVQLKETLDRHEMRAMRKACKSETETSWMNDNAIHCFLEAIADENTKIIGSIETEMILKGKNTGRLFHSDRGNLLESWASCCKIFLPYCVDGCHWALIYANVQSKKIYCLDPTGEWKLSSSQLRNLRKKLDTLNVTSSIEWELRKRDHYYQDDSSSCGPFICYYAESIMLERSLKLRIDPVEVRNHILETLVKAAESR